MVKNCLCQALLHKTEIEHDNLSDYIKELLDAKEKLIDKLEQQVCELNEKYRSLFSALEKARNWREVNKEQLAHLRGVIDGLRKRQLNDPSSDNKEP